MSAAQGFAQTKECRRCHRIGQRAFVPWGSEGWECSDDRACRGRADRRDGAESGSSEASPAKGRNAPRVYMIDGPTTRDRDDAFRVDETEDGWTITVHVAAVADNVPIGSQADLDARTVGATIYGARRTIPMLGSEVEQAATLKDSTARPSVVIEVSLDRRGSATGHSIRRGATENARALTYASATTILDSGVGGFRDDLMAAQRLALMLLDRRRDEGALALYDLRDGWTTTEEGVLVPLADAEKNIAYIIVQEMMIAANSAVSAWAAEHELPILFRNHQANAIAPSVKEIAQDITIAQESPDPQSNFQTLRQRTSITMRKATYGPRLLGHYGLNLPSYTHATSPLRRYADLVTQRQLLATLDGVELPYSAADLDVIAEELHAAAESRRRAIHEREKAKDVDRTLSAVDKARTLADLSPERWLKTLKLATKGPALEPIEIDVRRRIAEGLLDHQDGHLVLNAQSADWAPLQDDVLAYIGRANHPLSSMLLNQFTQLHPEAPVVKVAASQAGPSHQPVFSVTVKVGETVLPGRSASTAKLAQHRAAHAALSHLLGREVPTDDDVAVAAAAPSKAPVAPVAENPISWLSEHAQKSRLAPPSYSIVNEGTPQAPLFTCEATYSAAPGFIGEASAASKADAKTQAATALRQRVMMG